MTSFLFLAAALGGALNSVAGGGSFLTLPALLYAGVSPVTANATSTMALWPGSVSAAIAYRREVRSTNRDRMLALGAASMGGGLLGALLLVRTSDSSFMRLLPWLMLAAAATFTFGGGRPLALKPHEPAAARRDLAVMTLLQFVISIYGGYFGGGMGIMMLATLAIAGMTDIHAMNGLKTVLATAINGVALAQFVAAGAIAWGPGLVMIAGGTAGGYAGAALARRVDRRRVRHLVVAVSWAMTIYFFVR